MLIIGVNGPSGRFSYFTGAFPSMCGKTSTATLRNVTMVGDDIAYLKNLNRQIRAANVEKGLFGIIEGINSNDDPLIWKALHKPVEIIFSNVLLTENGDVYWNGKNDKPPEIGINHSGDWCLGKKDEDGKEITPSHKNARFTFDLKVLDNLDQNINEPMGVEVKGIIYGGRDSSTWVPVEESFDWIHGTITKGAALESETTAAALGKEGVRVFNPMSNLDFLSIPIGKYIDSHINFSANIDQLPRIFSVNYFLRGKDGNFLNGKNDKQVWLRWMEFRVHDEVDAIKTPTGYIPRYRDLKSLFEEELQKDYQKEAYINQFTLRIPENLSKIDRLLDIFQTRVLDTPKSIFEVLKKQKRRLDEARDRFGDHVSPEEF
jgi:phosphoenolpyruvate carboxykinase (GTP)